MGYEFRKKLYELDESGFIGTQSAKETKKVEIITSYLIRASKKMWKEQNRSLTDFERKQIIKETERAYKIERQQEKKTTSFVKAASVIL